MKQNSVEGKWIEQWCNQWKLITQTIVTEQNYQTRENKSTRVRKNKMKVVL